MTCLVCGSRQSESHFGGNSCRACAAFFRRYFNSKKFIIKCSCKSKTINSHPCRSCRVAKCFAVGMTPQKLCGQRDPNGSSNRLIASANENVQLALTPYIPPKDTTNITSTISNFSVFEKKRIHMFSSLGLQNVYAITSLTKNDTLLTEDLVADVFPDFGKLSSSDKRSLINGFVLKLWQIEPALDHVANRVEYRKMEEKDIQNIIFPFFNGSFMKGSELSENDIWRIFGPHWIYFFEKVIEAIVFLSLDRIELMAVIWILFFDHAYIDISSKSIDLCWNIRKVIHRELKNYLMEKVGNEEAAAIRFMDILEIPMIVERGEQKFLDEFIICELNQIRVHDDFREIVKKQRI
ncbi:hypothetical protein GCK72_019789 [Caenorhabditis remanei]|uniref:Nuclear receptor domain-containing protein n=1 Tax=Caenorhabditis remanei TaxID=31234 RepID=A0A6A5GEZ6_CAERE|nr:hypothetical protein GCK72_019789 [Caenorhabditis remanei]KAF1753233.1 hypothetical protein GCK72_019789 [Caenorhabditis remanei]